MNANVITRHIGIGMLAFCATFVQSSMFVASHFGGSANAQRIEASQALGDSAYARLDTVTSGKADRRGA